LVLGEQFDIKGIKRCCFKFEIAPTVKQESLIEPGK